MTSASCPGPLARVCRCHDVVPLAVTASNGAFHLGWICIRCLADDVVDGLLDVLSIYASHEDAEGNLLVEEYYASFEPADLDLDAIRLPSRRV